MAGSKDSQLSPIANSSRRNIAWHDVLETHGCIECSQVEVSKKCCLMRQTGWQDLQEGLRQQNATLLKSALQSWLSWLPVVASDSSSLLRSSMSQEILSEVRLEVDQSATALRKACFYTSADVCADS